MTFNELTTNCTQEERRQLAWFLAMYRAIKTYESLIGAQGELPIANAARNIVVSDVSPLELPSSGWKP
ncbi:MAG: hypothetical protein KGL39_57995 [Patescibacteria group bacterium]|nr:hypothetical protein [Patescibacteria group bacterium]